MKKQETIIYLKYNSMKKFKKWWYEFIHGHPFLLEEEVKIILKTRNDPAYKWMSDSRIKELIRIRIKEMYKYKYPKKIK